jgi:hypothetical protein
MDFDRILPEFWLTDVLPMAFPPKARHEGLIGLVARVQAKMGLYEIDKCLRETVVSLLWQFGCDEIFH